MHKKYFSAVGACICNCETYIQEWCCFQHLSGFDRIIIVLDRCTDDTWNRIEKLPDVVRRKVDVLNNDAHEDGYGFQHRAYQKMVDFYRPDVEWFAMLDDDEYLWSSKMSPINELLAAVPNNVGQVVVPWCEFPNTGQMFSASKEITRLRAFTRSCTPPVPTMLKSIVRLDSIRPSSERAGWYYCHWADVLGPTVSFDLADKSGEINRCAGVFATHDPVLVHYVHGSMEDYVSGKARKWQIEQDGYTHLEESAENRCNVKRFCEIQNLDTVADQRMERYAPTLINLLKQCKT